MQTTLASSCRPGPLCRAQTTERAWPAAIKTTATFQTNAAHISVHMLSPRDPTTSSGEQNLDGEPSWDAGGLQAPAIDDDLASQSTVSSKFTFTFLKSRYFRTVPRCAEGIGATCGRVP